MLGLPERKLNQQDAVAIAAAFLLAFACLFGGASRQNELRLALVELAALPLIVLSLSEILRRGIASEHRFALLLLAGVAMIPLLQLIPLPPAVWTSLPGRDQLALALDLAGRPQGWLPLTMTPDATWRSFLSLLPPLAMFLAMLTVGPIVRQRLIQAVIGITVAAICLGAAQLASGGERLYPWATTAAGNVTGFFANRNHLATLCLVGIPFATVLSIGAMRKGGPKTGLSLWAPALYVVLAVLALGVIRSRAGVVLVGPVLAGSLIAAWIAAGRGRPRTGLIGIVAGIALAVTAVSAFSLAPLLSRFDTQGAPEGRFENWPVVLEAANTYLPLGTGIGSFDPVYRSVEPMDRLDSTYFNQAHNDYLEIWLEAGWLGAALIIGFLVWFGRRAWTAWRSSVSTQRDLQRAATIAIGAVMLHSAVDYPLRTAAMVTIFALCCGLLELAVRSDAELTPERARRRRSS